MTYEIEFDEVNLSMRWDGETIRLLPKEYALLQFFARNLNLVLTRDQLLDAVWGMDAPVDRTVDDHVYRLRKKLKKLGAYFSIETVRGIGYRFVHQETVDENPLQGSEQVDQEIRQLWDQYLRFGQGKAITVLAEHRDILGFKVDTAAQIYFHFMRGDFAWVVASQDQPLWEKVFYLLHIYHNVHFNVRKTLRFFELALDNVKLPQRHREELKLNIIGLLIEAGELTVARMALDELYASGYVDEGILLFFRLSELILEFIENPGELAAKMSYYEELLAAHAYRRESGLFKIVRGLWRLSEGDKRQGEPDIKNGLRTLHTSGFFPHYLQGIRMIMLFVDKPWFDQRIAAGYRKLWGSLSKEYDFPMLEAKTEEILCQFL